MPPSFHLSFDETPSSVAFYGKGSRQTIPKEEQIASFVSPFERDTQMVFSGWIYVDASKHAADYWLLSVRDPNGAELQNIKVECRRSNDTQDSWIRGEALFNLPKGSKLQINAYGYKSMIVDEVMLWPKGLSPIVNDPNAATYLFENFKIRK